MLSNCSITSSRVCFSIQSPTMPLTSTELFTRAELSINFGSVVISLRPIASAKRNQTLCVLAASVRYFPSFVLNMELGATYATRLPVRLCTVFNLIVLDRVEIQKTKNRFEKRQIDHLPLAAAQIAMIKRHHDR